LSSTDTIDNIPQPDVTEGSSESLEQAHDYEGHDHDHSGHDHPHGPVLNPDCTRELVLDIPAEEVSKAYRTVTGNYRKYAKIPGFRSGKVPETVILRRFAEGIRKDVIDGILPERFNKAVQELGVKPVGEPHVTEMTVEDGQPLHMKAVFEFVPEFSIEGYQAVIVEKPPVEITDAEFQQELEQLRESRAMIEPVEEERALADGDWAQISYKGQIEGETDAAPIAGEDTPMFTGWLDENPVENYGDRTELESQVEELESHKDSFEEISFSVHGSSFLDRSVVEIWDSASMMERICAIVATPVGSIITLWG